MNIELNLEEVNELCEILSLKLARELTDGATHAYKLMTIYNKLNNRRVEEVENEKTS